MDEEKATEALDHILGEWKVARDPDGDRGLFRLLAPVAQWLKAGDENPAREVRAAQIVLSDPDRPGSGKKARLRGFLPTEVSSSELGDHASRIVNAQAIVLAVVESVGADHHVAPRMVSALPVLRLGERTKRFHTSWGESAMRADLSTADSTLTEFLWWGHARYSHTLREPFRRIAHDRGEVALWWAAHEAAMKAKTLAVEPSAAYLVETLVAVGLPDRDMRPLGEWMRALHRVLVASNVPPPPVRPAFAELVAADAQALPVTWVRLQAAKNRPLDDAEQHVGLDLSAEIDRGQWASWLFRELTLDLMFPQSSP